MYYVEWLRVRKVLLVLAIILGVFFLFAMIARIAVSAEIGRTQTWIVNESNKPGTRIAHERLADGAMQTTIDVPSDHDHIVIVDNGWKGKTVTVSGEGVQTDQTHNVQIGSIGVHSIRSSPHGGTVVVDTDEPMSIRTLFAVAALVAFIIATTLSGPLAKENTNHLEVVWTKPLSRERMALGMFGVDAIGMLASMALTIVFLVVCTALFELPRFVVDAQTWPVLALCVLAPFAWYALLTAVSASLKRGWGAVIGLGWLAALILPGIAFGLASAEMPLFHYLGVVLSWLMLLNPITYIHLSGSTAPGDADPAFGYMYGFLGSSATVRAAMLLGLVILYSALSLFQWRRLEA